VAGQKDKPQSRGVQTSPKGETRMKNHFTIKFPINVIVDGAIRLRTMSSVEMVQDDDGEWKFRELPLKME